MIIKNFTKLLMLFFITLTASVYGQNNSSNTRKALEEDPVLFEKYKSTLQANELGTNSNVNNAFTTKKEKIDFSDEDDALKSKSQSEQHRLNQSYYDYLLNRPLDSLQMRMFGASLFNNSNLTFEPNNNKPTPKNYILGPSDDININVYGLSVVNWKLKVSSEGFILLPGMGRLYVGGETIEVATEMIASRLKQNNFAIGSGTEVAVSLANLRSISVNVIGEVGRPGTYVMSSLSTVFNALYASGGPTNIGSFRRIEVIRDNRIIEVIDAYDYLTKGDITSNITLKDDDIIRVPPYKVRIVLDGEVKKPGIFEVLPSESLKDILSYAGGFTDKAYIDHLKIYQYTDKERRIKDIPYDEIASYVPLRGDSIHVNTIINKFENVITIQGAVNYPGQYSLDDGLTISQLLINAGGLKDNAFKGRGYITRTDGIKSNLIPIDIGAALTGKFDNIKLQKNDMLMIPAATDLMDTKEVQIGGKVRKAGKFPFIENMTVHDLILMAGGFTEGANTNRVSVARRVIVDKSNPKATSAEVVNLTIDKELKLIDAQYKLQTGDIVSIFALPGYEGLKTVTIEGEVMNPGIYPILTKDERISDIIKRAEGITAFAYLDAGTLKRQFKFETTAEQEKENLDNERIKRIQNEVEKDSSVVNKYIINQNEESKFVGINLNQIMKKPGVGTDLILEDGDIITIPKKKELIRVSGEVLTPVSIVYQGKGFNQYIDQSGGYTTKALRSRSYVSYANGTKQRTKGFLFIKTHPVIKPGAEIFIPTKKDPGTENIVKTQMWVSLGTSVGTLGAIILGVLSTLKK